MPAAPSKPQPRSLKRSQQVFRFCCSAFNNFARNPLQLWIGLAGLAFCLHLALLISTKSPLPLLLFCIVLWAVAWLPIEDITDDFIFAPPRSRILVSIIFWIPLLVRGSQVQSYADPFNALFPFLAGLVIAYLPFGVVGFIKLRESLLILALMPVLAWLPSLIPTAPLSRSAAAFATFLLQTFGADAALNGVRIVLNVAAVNVAGPCSGNEMMVQAFVVALLACIVFPMPNRWLRFPFLILAPLLGWFANGLRVALLVLIASIDPASSLEDSGVFGFFHLGEGGIVFSSLGIALYAYIYVKILEYQLRTREDGRHES
ncbi:MAG: exosortase/archaeosortase family protein [Cyanobium sp.]